MGAVSRDLHFTARSFAILNSRPRLADPLLQLHYGHHGFYERAHAETDLGLSVKQLDYLL